MRHIPIHIMSAHNKNIQALSKGAIGFLSKPAKKEDLNNLFSNITATSPDFSTITKIGLEVTAGSGGATVVYFDGIRINDEDTFDPTYGMISRSVLGTPLVKPSGRAVDIEYRVVLGF